MDKERWIVIYNIGIFSGRYSISNLGRITSLNVKSVMKIQTDKFGYKIISFCVGGVKKTFKVHRLVANAFIPNIENRRCVNHKDGDKSNNRVSNLEWVTHSENLKHAHRTGLKRPQQLGKSGKLHTRSKPVVSTNQTAIIEHESINLCAKYFGVTDKAIHVALKNGSNCRGSKIYYL